MVLGQAHGELRTLLTGIFQGCELLGGEPFPPLFQIRQMLVPVGQRIFSKAAGDVQDLELQLVQAFLFRLDTSPILMGAMAILEAVGGTASPIALTGIIVGDLLGQMQLTMPGMAIFAGVAVANWRMTYDL